MFIQHLIYSKQPRELGTAVMHILQLSQLRLGEVHSLPCSHQLAVVQALRLTGHAGTLACRAIPRSALRPSPAEREYSSGIKKNPVPTRPASLILGSVVLGWVPDEDTEE